MQRFISCDWGTSALRLKIIETDEVSVLGQVMSQEGIVGTFNLWKQSGKKESEKLSFYQSILNSQISILEEQSNCSVQGMPLIISGMASSGIGMMELPYKELSFFADGSDLFTKTIDATDDFNHEVLMISGAKTADDVMRGEETQLTGCLDENDKEERLFILPGTHSKHIRVKNGWAIDIQTYMTGELFDILSKKSILSISVQEGEGLTDNANKDSFGKGVSDAARSNILHTLFGVRTNGLFNKLNKQENYYYLSGLLIGTELREMKEAFDKKITVVVNEHLKPFYIAALKELGLNKDNSSVLIENADQALIKGQLKVWNNLG